LIKRLLGQAERSLGSAEYSLYVAESLGHLLNTRQGMAIVPSTYGLPDFYLLTHAPSQLLYLLERQIFESLKIYETRLQDLRVRGNFDPDIPERLCFSIQAKLMGRREVGHVNYQSMLLPGGRVMVKAL
jgi:type VI secretion system protein